MIWHVWPDSSVRTEADAAEVEAASPWQAATLWAERCAPVRRFAAVFVQAARGGEVVRVSLHLVRAARERSIWSARPEKPA